MNRIELDAFKQLMRECEELRYQNTELRVQVKDLKADLGRIQIKNLMANNPITTIEPLKEGENN